MDNQNKTLNVLSKGNEINFKEMTDTFAVDQNDIEKQI